MFNGLTESAQNNKLQGCCPSERYRVARSYIHWLRREPTWLVSRWWKGMSWKQVEKGEGVRSPDCTSIIVEWLVNISPVIRKTTIDMTHEWVFSNLWWIFRRSCTKDWIWYPLDKKTPEMIIQDSTERAWRKSMIFNARKDYVPIRRIAFPPINASSYDTNCYHQSFKSPWVGAVPPPFSSILPFLPSFSLTALAAKSESTASTSTPSSLKSEACAAAGTISTPSSLSSEAGAAAVSSGFSTVSQSSGVCSWAGTDSVDSALGCSRASSGVASEVLESLVKVDDEGSGRSEDVGGNIFLEPPSSSLLASSLFSWLLPDKREIIGETHGTHFSYALTSLSSNKQNTTLSNFPIPSSLPFFSWSSKNRLTSLVAISAAWWLGYPYMPVLIQLKATLPPFSAANSRLVL